MSKGGQSSGQQVKPDMTDNLIGLLQKAESRSHNLFEGNFTIFYVCFNNSDVLTQKDKADKIRNTLAVLQRFKVDCLYKN
jgi:hypothetical protein